MTIEDQANQEQPIVRICVACDRVLQEKDESLTVVRIVELYVVKRLFGASSESPSTSEQMTPVPVPVTFLFSTIAGPARGHRELALRVVKPDGSRSDGPKLDVEYDSEIATRNWVVQMALGVIGSGIYWIEWLCNGIVLMRLPLQIQYERELTSGRTDQ